MNFTYIRQFCDQIFFIQKSRNIQNTDFFCLSIHNMNICPDQSGWCIQNYFCIWFFYRNHSCLYYHGSSSDTSMSTHIQASATVHKDHTKISFLMDRLCQKCSEHVPMSTRFQHQRRTKKIIIFHKVLLFLHHRFPGKIRKTIINNSGRFSHCMGINRFDLISIWQNFWLKSHDSPFLSK